MPDTEASLGYGTVFRIADPDTPTTFTYIGEIFDLTPPSEETEDVEATHMQSPNGYREYISGLTDAGETSFEMNYVPGSPSDLAIVAAKGKRKWCKTTFPNGVSIFYFGTRTGYERAAPTDDRMTATVTFKVSGEPIQSVAAAPENITAPALTGPEAGSPPVLTPQVGAPVTLDKGVWAGAQSLAVQWQKGAGSPIVWSDITDATGLAYIPVTGDVGSPLRAKVTGSNGSFSTEALSAATAAVVA